ncbi:MAG TPA: NAD(P)-dependent oxidoreductase [Chthoniobacteraceae bacterium]
MSQKIAVVGVGRMGANMARRLKDRGFEITAVYDLDRNAAELLSVELQCAAPATLPEITAAAEIVITVVTDDEAMDDIFGSIGSGSDSLLTSASGVDVAEGTLFINCATVTPGTHVLVESRCEEAGAQSLEACMASSITQAREGSLFLMCGGKSSAFERALPVLEALGSQPRYLGPAGTAATLKALVNMVMNINTAALAEGLGLADALGLDLTVVREIFAQTGAASRVLETDGEDMQNREHTCFFSAAHAAKDSGIAVHLAREAGLAYPLAEATKAQYDKMVFEGLGELDKSGIAELTFKGRYPAD